MSLREKLPPNSPHKLRRRRDPSQSRWETKETFYMEKDAFSNFTYPTEMTSNVFFCAASSTKPEQIRCSARLTEKVKKC